MTDQKTIDQSSKKEDNKVVQANRQYWRCPASSLLREIWQPGDGDGEHDEDFFERSGPPAPVGKRWRLYVSPHDISDEEQELPKYVMLDDKAVYRVLRSGTSKAKAALYWSHDFGTKGTIRHHRTHRGKAAVTDQNADGMNKYGWAFQGVKKTKYYLIGEQDFSPLNHNPDIPVAQSTTKTKDATQIVNPTKKRKAAG